MACKGGRICETARRSFSPFPLNDGLSGSAEHRGAFCSARTCTSSPSGRTAPHQKPFSLQSDFDLLGETIKRPWKAASSSRCCCKMPRPLKSRGAFSLSKKPRRVAPQAQIGFYLFSPATCASEKIPARKRASCAPLAHSEVLGGEHPTNESLTHWVSFESL